MGKTGAAFLAPVSFGLCVGYKLVFLKSNLIFLCLGGERISVLYRLTVQQSVFLGYFLFVASAFPTMGTETTRGARILEEVRGHLERPQGLPLDVRAQTQALKRYYESPKARLLWFQEGRTDQLIEVLKKLQND